MYIYLYLFMDIRSRGSPPRSLAEDEKGACPSPADQGVTVKQAGRAKR